MWQAVAAKGSLHTTASPCPGVRSRLLDRDEYAPVPMELDPSERTYPAHANRSLFARFVSTVNSQDPREVRASAGLRGNLAGRKGLRCAVLMIWTGTCRSTHGGPPAS